MPPLQHQLSWSVSRAGTLRRCARHYYYDYYLSWLGWDRAAAESRQQAYRLKKMSRLPMLTGSLVHEAIQGWFEAKAAGQLPVPQMVKSLAVEGLEAAWRESRDAKAAGRFWPAAKGAARLAEHYYVEPMVDEASGSAAEYLARHRILIERCLDAFFDLPELSPVRDAEPQDYLAVEAMGTFDVDGVPVYAVPDFAMERIDPETELPGVWIFDWKTGQPRALDSHQLQVYVLYAMRQWGVVPEDVTCVLAYLREGRLETHRFDMAAIEAVAHRIKASIDGLRSTHFDAGASLGDPEAFPMVPLDQAGPRTCLSCNYRELCGRG
ncbi:MAG: PD-(D/E)XK nuclease family protein [Chloroflexi bacterium]|nr:PD-(D/E)XK nuclease family protein [Chloroflexota bacterium]